MLARIQNDLFDLGADLATPKPIQSRYSELSELQVTRLEAEIDKINKASCPRCEVLFCQVAPNWLPGCIWRAQ